MWTTIPEKKTVQYVNKLLLHTSKGQFHEPIYVRSFIKKDSILQVHTITIYIQLLYNICRWKKAA